jgi:hypothetical protein
MTSSVKIQRMAYKKVRVFSSSVQNCRMQNTEYIVRRRNMYTKEEERKKVRV